MSKPIQHKPGLLPPATHKQIHKDQADLVNKHPAKHAQQMITAQFAVLQNPPASGPSGPML
jgi:hypothetical protein